MATVRTPSRGIEPGTKRKRTRLNHPTTKADSKSTSRVEVQLQTLEKWYRTLTIDMSELRSECARVRLELEKVDDLAEAAVENSERCAEHAQAAQERALAATKIKEEAAESTESKVHFVTAEMDRVTKTCNALDKKMASFNRTSVTEEFLMTQLTALQEQYENELSKVREEALEAQHKQLERVMVHLKDEKSYKKQMETMARLIQSLSDENKILNYKMRQVATLQQRVERIERDKDDEQGRTRVEVSALNAKLFEMERRVTNAEDKALEVDRIVDNLSPQPTGTMSNYATPASVPRAVVQQEELNGVHDELRRINCDLRAVGADINSLAKHTDERGSQTRHHMEARLQELSKQLFDALGHDSRLHASMISRLKDTLFDVQSDHREFAQRIKKLEDDVLQAIPVQPRDRLGFNQHQSTVLPPPHPAAFWNRREAMSRYEPAPYKTMPAFDPLLQERMRWTHQSRSRSRSPPPQMLWGAKNNDQCPSGSIEARSGRHNQRGNQPFYHSKSPAHNVLDRAHLPQDSTEQDHNAHDNRGILENNQAERPVEPVRRFRQPPKAQEVIIIEEDEDDDEDDKGENNANEGLDDVDNGSDLNADVNEDPARAPPDIVLDENDMIPSTSIVVVETPEPRSSNTDDVEMTDILENETDLQTGLLLYFCLGGAPDLDVNWTNYFTQLDADECVEMPRALQFQRRYSFLQSFSVHLTQCILQAVILNRHNVCEKRPGSDASQIAGALNAAKLRTEFENLVQGMHLSWAQALNNYLLKQVGSLGGLASEKLELSISPAGLSSLADEDDAVYAWSQQQESIMWNLARKLHHGPFVPALECNIDASPAVYLFVLLFDVLTVTSECPQYGTFRLNAFGSKAFASLWNHTLKKLPYMFFADWSWLEDQSTKERLPALAFCHILATIMLWNSAIDRHSLRNENIYTAVVKQISHKLYVGGRAVFESTNAADFTSLALGEWESTHIELLDLDCTFASTLGLNGFFEITEAIQNNMLAMAASINHATSP